MPGVVDSPRDEHKWDRAKEIAAEAGKGENYAYIMGIYKKMNPDHSFTSSEHHMKASIDRLRRVAFGQHDITALFRYEYGGDIAFLERTLHAQGNGQDARDIYAQILKRIEAASVRGVKIESAHFKNDSLEIVASFALRGGEEDATLMEVAEQLADKRGHGLLNDIATMDDAYAYLLYGAVDGRGIDLEADIEVL